MPYDIKQVIVVRSDLHMRRGKEAAQVAHAAMKWLVNKITKTKSSLVWTPEEYDWMNGLFTKVVVSVESLEDLDAVERNAISAGLAVSTIVDSGATEFKGVPTKTCIAIGPDRSDKIDKITGHLKLR